MYNTKFRILWSLIVLILINSNLYAQDTNVVNNQYKYGEITFNYPAGWSAEKIKSMNGLLIINPKIENNWQSNLLFEYRIDNENRSVHTAINTVTKNLAKTKTKFTVINKDKIKLSNDKYAARLEYTHVNSNTRLKEWEIIIPLKGAKRLFIVASSESSLWARDKKYFEEVIQSIIFD